MNRPLIYLRRFAQLVAVVLLAGGVASCSGTKNQQQAAQVQAVPTPQDFLYDGDYGIGVPFSPRDSRGSATRTRVPDRAPSIARGGDQPYAAPSEQPATPQMQRSATETRLAAARSHEVRPGDSLWRISQQYGTSVPALMAANSLSSDVIRSGSVLAIP